MSKIKLLLDVIEDISSLINILQIIADECSGNESNEDQVH